MQRHSAQFEAVHFLWLIPAAMLLLALAPWPYGYYRLLRWVVCGCCLFIAYKSYERSGASVWLVGLLGLAALFNPIVPVHLTRRIWAPIDLGAAAFLGAHLWFDELRASIADRRR